MREAIVIGGIHVGLQKQLVYFRSCTFTTGAIAAPQKQALRYRRSLCSTEAVSVLQEQLSNTEAGPNSLRRLRRRHPFLFSCIEGMGMHRGRRTFLQWLGQALCGRQLSSAAYTLACRSNLFTSGAVLLLQVRSLHHRSKLFATGAVSVVQKQSLYYRSNYLTQKQVQTHCGACGAAILFFFLA